MEGHPDAIVSVRLSEISHMCLKYAFMYTFIMTHTFLMIQKPSNYLLNLISLQYLAVLVVQQRAMLAKHKR